MYSQKNIAAGAAFRQAGRAVMLCVRRKYVIIILMNHAARRRARRGMRRTQKNRSSIRLRAAAAVLAACVLVSLALAGCSRAETRRNRAAALRMADFILSLQAENGAIPDAAGADSVNEDSNMEYALIALAAAYRATGREAYLTGLARGIAWLADAEVMEDGPWRGSWWYRCSPDGQPLPSPQAYGVTDVRGVDATSALFVYLLYLYERCTGSSAYTDGYRENAGAALDFLLTRSRTEDGFFASSFQQDAAGVWSRYGCCYAADQGDVWLGLRAAALLYGGEYAQTADFLEKNVPAAFFSEARGRYCTGISDGQPDWSEDGFAPVQSQGFLPWLWGDTPQNRAAVQWLQEWLDGGSDGSYFLSAAFLRLGESGLGEPPSDAVARWLLSEGADASTGGVYDSPADHTETVNVAAFCVLSLLEAEPFPS